MKMYLVGGIVRDMLLGLKPKDHDFTVVLPQDITCPFEYMKFKLEERGIEIFVETPEFLTIRGRFAKDDPEYPGIAGDFVLARKDSTTKKCPNCNSGCDACHGTGTVAASDGRRPDYVEAGTLFDDLARRDFTVNAMAISKDGKIIDYFGGQCDLKNRVLKFVGDPMSRINEDALRVMRAFRFMITKGFEMEPYSIKAICDERVPPLLEKISEDRRADELSRMLRFDTEKSLDLLANIPRPLRAAMFAGRVRLDSTLRR